MFEIRPLNKTDYDEILLDWWNDWGWTPPQKNFLPNNGAGGLMVLDGDVPICAGFLYTTNSDVAWVDWIISNKQYRKKPQRENAIGLLIETLTGTCKRLNFKYSYALIKHRGLIETYKKLGYIEADSYTQEMIKVL
jgi:hypothetical protein